MRIWPFTPGLSGFRDQSQANSALYSAFWSVEPTDFKNIIVENIHWTLLRTPRSPRSNDLEIQKAENFIMKSHKNYMILKFWPLWPRKWLLNLSSFRGCPVDFILDYIFEISDFHWSKWAITCLIRKTFIFQIFNIQPPKLLTNLKNGRAEKKLGIFWTTFESVFFMILRAKQNVLFKNNVARVLQQNTPVIGHFILFLNLIFWEICRHLKWMK